MKNIRVGVIGLGNMGQAHAKLLGAGRVPRARLTAVADADTARLAAFPEVAGFDDGLELIRSGRVEAVIIATPHFSHVPLGVAALSAGLHVLMEKPIAVQVEDGMKLMAAHRSPQQVFAAMFNQRTDPRYRKLRDLIRTGELGAVRRISWTVTDWFRTQAYYNSGGWRATWAGEGGGVLLNQCPHNLDLWQWLFGQPSSIRAFCHIARYHDIEVEDDVTAYLEYAGGTTGVFVTSTGEAPGSNRLEIAAEMGRVVVEGDRLSLTRNEVPMSEFCRTSAAKFDAPRHQDMASSFPTRGGQHEEIIVNFVDAILDGAALIAPAGDGLRSVELANAMLLSSFERRTVELPLDPVAFSTLLHKKISESHAGRSFQTPSGRND